MLVARRKFLRGLLALCDAATIVISFAAAHLILERLFGRGFDPLGPYLWVWAAAVVIWPLALRGFGLYHSAIYVQRARLLARVVYAQLLGALILLSALYLSRDTAVSRLFLYTFLALSLAALVCQKLALRAYLQHLRDRIPLERRKVLLVGRPETAQRYLTLLREHASMLADIVGMVVPARDRLARSDSGLPILGTLDDIPLLMRSRVIDEIVIADALEIPALERLLRWCAMRGALMRMLIDTPRPPLGIWNAEHLGQGAFALSFAAVPQNPLHLAGKRAFDVAVALFGLLACGVAWLWYGARLRRETGDTVLFRQRRVGRNGRRFTTYKFRTMHARAEELKTGLIAQNEMRGPIFKMSRDPRVTPTGRELRRRHLDELPQFWNVLRGEMSLVGTRPPTEDEVAAYDEHHHRRLSMKPGLTGLWQLNACGAIKDFEDVVKLDCEYIDNWSLWLDLKIMGRTVAKVMRGDGW